MERLTGVSILKGQNQARMPPRIIWIVLNDFGVFFERRDNGSGAYGSVLTLSQSMKSPTESPLDSEFSNDVT
jgi:hypothetical protein